MIKPTKLVCKCVSGAGLQIHANLDKNANFLEYVTAPGEQLVFQPLKADQLIGYEPWAQFPPKEWNDMLDKLLNEMVDAWNEKYSS